MVPTVRQRRCCWDTVNNAVLAEGKRLLINDPTWFEGVKVIGVDEHVWRHTRRGDKYVTVIIDLTPVRDVPAELVEIDWAAQYADRFRAAMDDDFNTPEAVAVLFELASEVLRTRSGAQAGLLRALGGVLGLLQRSANDFLQGGAAQGGLPIETIEALIAERVAAKKARDFARSDAIRDELKAQGVVLEDSAQGTSWRRG